MHFQTLHLSGGQVGIQVVEGTIQTCPDHRCRKKIVPDMFETYSLGKSIDLI